MTSLDLRLLSTADLSFASSLDALIAFESAQDPAIDAAVAAIIADVRARGDEAVLEYTRRFDRLDAASVQALEVSPADLAAACDALPGAERDALAQAAARVRRYHERQRGGGFSVTDEDGSELGQRITPLDRVGIYVPGGKAAYPSSVLMNALPAQVAGVREIFMAVPTPGGVRNPLVFAAAHIAGVSRVFTIGGAQAIAALAYGTQSVPAVDKICGPGNAYVAAAKRGVFGAVGIDMIAGVSEIVIVADGTANADWIALDLFSQAEHDEMAQAILVTPDEALIARVSDSAQRLIKEMPRAG
ncbi:MAG: histidinol dehydrogenase, partial [Casimicrobiaceae bacterium]